MVRLNSGITQYNWMDCTQHHLEKFECTQGHTLTKNNVEGM